MLTHDSTDSRAYAPAVEARKNLSEIAATKTVVLYGVTAPNALEAPGELSFGDFNRRPEALELYGAPANSDSSVLLLEFQQAFTGAATLVRELQPYPNNARTHSKKQVRQIANSIKRFGFNNPVLIDDKNQIVAVFGLECQTE